MLLVCVRDTEDWALEIKVPRRKLLVKVICNIVKSTPRVLLTVATRDSKTLPSFCRRYELKDCDVENLKRISGLKDFSLGKVRLC